MNNREKRNENKKERKKIKFSAVICLVREIHKQKD
jgi:hypothetical protein